MNNNKPEIWLPLFKFEDTHEISNMGNVRSIKRQIKGKNNVIKNKPSKILIKTKNKNGYLDVRINGKVKIVHRLVALTFIPNPENKPQVNHINGIKTDNQIENLEWCTNSENQLHAYKLGLNKNPIGELNGNCTLSAEQVREIIDLYKNKIYTQKELGAIYNVSQGQISYICRGSGWNNITEGKNNKPVKQKYNKENLKDTLLNRIKNNNKTAPITIQQINKNTNEVINTFFSTKEASDITNIPRTSIRAVISGNMKCTGEFIWKKLNQ